MLKVERKNKTLQEDWSLTRKTKALQENGYNLYMWHLREWSWQNNKYSKKHKALPSSLSPRFISYHSKLTKNKCKRVATSVFQEE